MPDDVARLVDESLARGDTSSWMPRCSVCFSDWHGRRDPDNGCPGMHADRAVRERWLVLMGFQV